MAYSKESGARHVSLEACAAAPQTVALRGPQPESPDDRERATRLLLAHPWRFATTMPTIPHWYSLRRDWDAAAFEWVVRHIRNAGYEEARMGRLWTYYNVAEWRYWTMGAPVAETTLINRARRRPPSLFDDA